MKPPPLKDPNMTPDSTPSLIRIAFVMGLLLGMPIGALLLVVTA